MYGFRWLFTRIFLGKDMYPEALETEINKELENGRSDLNDQSIEKDMKQESALVEWEMVLIIKKGSTTIDTPFLSC